MPHLTPPSDGHDEDTEPLFPHGEPESDPEDDDVTAAVDNLDRLQTEISDEKLQEELDRLRRDPEDTLVKTD